MAPPGEEESAKVEKLLKQFEKRLEEIGSSDPAAKAKIKGMMAGLKEGDLKVEEAIEGFSDLNRVMRETAGAADDFQRAMERTVKTLTGVTSGSGTLIGSWMNMEAQARSLKNEIAELDKKVKDGNLSNEDRIAAAAELTEKSREQETAQNKQAAALEKYLKNLNPVASITAKVVEATFTLAIANDQATAAFNKSSGAAGVFDYELTNLEQSNRQFGISTAEITEAFGALQSGLSGFGVMAKSERKRLTELGSQFAKIGVSGADFAGTLQTMTRTLGMSAEAATRMQEEARVLAQTLGKNVGQVLSELNQALPKLAAYGDDATEMFKELQLSAQRTGLELGELIDLTAKFDTFDSAATAAGNLNAVLGTQQFSTMAFLESVQEGGDSLVNYLTDTLQASGTAWESLEYFQRNALANAAGLDVATLSNIMNAEAQSVQDRERAATMKETMAAGRAMWDELKIAATQFALNVQPLMDGFVWTLQRINGILTVLTEKLGPISGMIKGMFAIAGAMAFVSVLGKIMRGYKMLTSSLIAFKAFSGPAGWASLAIGGAVLAGTMKAWSSYQESHAHGGFTTGGMSSFAEQGAEAAKVGDNWQVFGTGGRVSGRPPVNTEIMNNKKLTQKLNQPPSRGQNIVDNSGMESRLDSLNGTLKQLEANSRQSKGDTVLKIDGRELGRVIDKKLGGDGDYRAMDLRTA